MAGYSATYGYDAKDERVAWADSAEQGIGYTLRGLDNEILREVHELGGVWTWKKDYVVAGGTHIASVDSAGLTHVHKDHLGSTRVITSASGAVVSQHRYWPFGEEMTVTSSPERVRFAGHERDRLTSLDYMHARYYAPFGGRFLSVDPGRDFDLSHPQSWNVYAYVRNNPVNGTDPTGKEKTGFEKELFEAFISNPRPGVPEQRAFELAMGAAVGGLVAIPAVALVAPAAVASGGVGAAIGAASSLPVLSDSTMPADAKVRTLLVSGVTSGVSAAVASPGDAAATGIAGGIGSFLARLGLGSSVAEALAAAAVSGQGGATGGVVARQLSSELVKSKAGLTAVASGIQGVFDVIKALIDLRKAELARKVGESQKAAVMLNATTNPVTGQESGK